MHVGDTFDRWTLLYRGIGRRRDGQTETIWLCRCICLAIKEVKQKHLVSRMSKSCGCLSAELSRARLTLHHQQTCDPIRIGHKHEYETWRSMIRRCNDPRHPSYQNYAGRGISVCERWRNSFADFLHDVGTKPSPGYSLDRFPDNHGNYEPGNVRWATPTQQARNMRSNRPVTFKGMTMPLAAWAEHLGKDPRIVRSRLQRGWTDERALLEAPMLNADVLTLARTILKAKRDEHRSTRMLETL